VLANYTFAPSVADRVLDASGITASCQFNVIKTNTNTKKLSLLATGWTIQASGGTTFDLPGSNTNSATANHLWTCLADFASMIIYVSPSA
jgi:hypothetical protein